MSKVEVYLRGENCRNPKLIEVLESASIKDIIELYHRENPGEGEPHEINLFLEGDEHPKNKEHAGHEAGIKKKVHIHCHRCTQIAVRIIYNGDEKEFHFSPAATAKVVLKKVAPAFNIAEADAGDYLLKIDDKTILQASDHIGSFTSYPNCQVKLFLTATKPVQG